MNPSCTREIKVHFLCGLDHFARWQHSRDDGTAAIERLNEKYPAALLTVKEMSVIHEAVEVENEEEAKYESEWVRWKKEFKRMTKGLRFLI